MNQSILNMEWAANGEIISNDGDIATLEIPESNGSVLLSTKFAIKRAETDCSRARFIDEFHISAQVEILNEIGRQPSYRFVQGRTEGAMQHTARWERLKRE